MQKLVSDYLNELNRKQKKRRKASIAVVLLVVLVVGGVVGSLTQYGVALTGSEKCGLEEHQHSEACYTSGLACGLEESGGHTHTDACRYPEELVCGLEEGASQDGESTEEGTEGHIHSAACYAVPEGWACGLEESEGHTHTDSCYTSELTCGKEEHIHTEDCYIDRNADVEDASVWDAQYADTEWKEAWGENLVMAAQMQVGYEESSDNYIVAEDGSHKGYTRYGQFAVNNGAGNPETGIEENDKYADWDAAFVNFCLYYAGLTSIEPKVFIDNPGEMDTAKWCEEFGKVREENSNYLTGPEGYEPEAGDLIFFARENEETAEQMGIVSSYNKENGEVKVIEGNSGNQVRENTYDASDSHIVRYLKVTELERDYKTVDEDAAEETEQEDTAAEDNAVNPEDGNSTETEQNSETNKEDDDNAATEDSEADQTQEDGKATEPEIDKYENGMSLEDLENLPEDEVGSAIWQSEATMSRSKMRRAAARNSSNWSLDAYYVSQSDRYDVTKTSDFNLKYQMEFHTSRNFSANELSIKIERALLENRSGENINPDQIAVPEVGRQNGVEVPVENTNMPFNYRIITEEDEEGKSVEYIEFFNYTDIASGTNIAWQILYKNLKIMQLRDGTMWELNPTVTIWEMEEENPTEIKKDENGQKITANVQTLTSLTGEIDSTVELTSLTKKEYKAYDKSYTPELYTPTQVRAYADYIENPEEFFIKDESGKEILNPKYRFAVWEVTMKGKSSQPWAVLIDEQVGKDGVVVGYKDNSNVAQGYDTPIDSKGVLTTVQKVYGESYGVAIAENQKTSWSSRFYVVTAYPADKVTDEDSEIDNTITVMALPCDGVDDPWSATVRRNAQADWDYREFDWKYSGNVISIKKENKNLDNEPYAGWLEVYKRLSENGEDYGAIPFTSTGKLRGYSYTHQVSGEQIGQYREGTSYKLITADDIMYADIGNEKRMLTDEDYYYSKVSIMQKDEGYDVWEDAVTPVPEVNGNIEKQSVIISAMFEGKDKWEEVATIPWNNSGVMSYEFSPEQIARKPWRVKAEHVSTNYRTTCEINVEVCMKSTSPVMEEVLDAYGKGELSSVKFEDLSGVIGQVNEGDRTWELIQGSKEQAVESTVNYNNRPELKEETRKLYDVLKDVTDEAGEFPMYRDNAYKEVTGLQKHAASYKAVTDSTNDVQNNRGQIVYSLTAHDGYQIFSADAVTELRRTGLESPGRTEVVFYDLLPYGMNFDPSYQVRAGRVTELDRYFNYTRNPGLWDSSQVEVRWDTQENYRDTGRTLVAFHISYSGADSAVYSSKSWLEGWGVSFRAYYDWKDVEIVKGGTNISAFMTAPKDPRYTEPLLGTDKEVAYDDGKAPDGSPLKGEYEDFGAVNGDEGKSGGIDGNQENDGVRSVLYASNSEVDDVAQSSLSQITKKVRADRDEYNPYRGNASVEENEDYTYEIAVSTASKDLKDIIIYDHLENAKTDRGSDKEAGKDANAPFDNATWTGTLQSVITSGLEKMGINAVVYYSDDRNAPMNLDEELNELETTGGADSSQTWYTEEKFRDSHGGKLEDAKSIAVDLRKTKDGEDFVLANGKALSFRIKMKAPAINEENPEGYAYNSPAYSSSTVDSGGSSEGSYTNLLQWGDSTKVRIKKASDLEVIKEFTGDIPDAVKNNAFEFRLYDQEENVPFSYQVYELYKKDGNGEYQLQQGQYATDGNGFLDLKAGEKAVFRKVPDVSRIKVEETQNIFWESEIEEVMDETENTVRRVTVTNRYRPVLYVQKQLEGVPDEVNMDGAEFTFQIKTGEGEESQPLANAKYYYVDSVRTNGGIPKVLTDKGENGEGQTDENGRLTIRKGEIIALFPGNAGTKYEVKEVDVSEDWICRTDTVTGTLPVGGASAVIRNIYKWKDLYLTKKITHQDPEECNEEFTFKIVKVNTVNGEEKEEDLNSAERERIQLSLWIEKGSGYEQIESTDLTLGSDGTFRCNCAGKTVRIRGLEAGATYRIKEIVAEGSDYRPDNDTAEITLPVFGDMCEAAITNDYQKRSLSITKNVVGGEPSADAEFTMEVKVNGELLINTEYTLMEDGVAVDTRDTDQNGKIILKNNQTAVFKDIARVGDEYEVGEILPENSGYKQIFPADGEAHTGKFSGDATELTFINANESDGSNLYISKVYEPADGDETAIEYIDGLKDKIAGGIYDSGRNPREADVEISLSVNGNMISDIPITVINQLTGEKLEDETRWREDNYKLRPWHLVIISENDIKDKLIESGEPADGELNYELSELPRYQHQIKNVSKYRKTRAVIQHNLSFKVEISQKEPTEDKSVIGTVKDNPVATITNEIRSLETGNRITKEMAKGSDSVPLGSKLVWRVERYNGSSWIPAEGISYITEAGEWDRDDRSDQIIVTTSDRVLVTGADGKIELKKSNNIYEGREMWPAVSFIDSIVKVNIKEPLLGDLRVVEVMEESDEAWGMLAAYKKKAIRDTDKAEELDKYSRALGGAVNRPDNPGKDSYTAIGLDVYDISDGGFINSNRKTPVDISKEMEEKFNDTFTMILKQVISLDEKGNVTVSESRSGISYTVYDSETNEIVDYKTTGNNGEILLKAGQYARLELPEGTQWTVTENLDHTYQLKSLEPETPTANLKKLDSNLMLINPGNTDYRYTVRYHDIEGNLIHTEMQESNQKITPWNGLGIDGEPAWISESQKEEDMIYSLLGWTYFQGSRNADIEIGEENGYLNGDVDLYPAYESYWEVIYHDANGNEIYTEKISTESRYFTPWNGIGEDGEIVSALGVNDTNYLEGWSFESGGECSFKTNGILEEINGNYNLYPCLKDKTHLILKGKFSNVEPGEIPNSFSWKCKITENGYEIGGCNGSFSTGKWNEEESVYEWDIWLMPGSLRRVDIIFDNYNIEGKKASLKVSEGEISGYNCKLSIPDNANDYQLTLTIEYTDKAGN